MTSQVVSAALWQKLSLQQRQERTVAEMTRHWEEIRRSLDWYAEQTLQEIRLRFPTGEVPAEWLNELSAYRQLSEQADNAIRDMNGYSYKLTSEQIISEIRLAQDEALGTISAARGRGMGYFAGLPVGQIEAIAGATSVGQPLAVLFDAILPDGKEQITAALMEGLARGQPTSVIARSMVERFNMPLTRASLIARTEVNRAHRSSTLATYREYGVRRFKRIASKEHACMACLMLDGQVYYSENGELEDHPNGACAMVPWVEGADEPTWEYGKDYFATLTPDEQRRRMGSAYYEAWQRGDYKLGALVTIKPNRIWGGAPQVTPLKDLSPDWQRWFYGKGDYTDAMPSPAEFTPAPTFATRLQAEKYVMQKYGYEKGFFKGLDAGTCNEIISTLNYYGETYPELLKQGNFRIGSSDVYFERLGASLANRFAGKGYSNDEIQQIVKQLVTRSKRNFKDALAWYTDTSNGDMGGIWVFAKRNSEEIGDAMKRAEALKFHPVGTGSLKAVLDHEIGHLLHYAEMSDADQLTAAARTYMNKGGVWVAGNLSSYAMTNTREFIAEAWSEFLNNPSPRAVAVDIGKAILAFMRGKFR